MKRKEILDNLNELGLDAKSKGLGLEIELIIRTVVGSEYDKDFDFFVRLALEASGRITLEEIVTGILTLKEWQKKLC
jgi:hypothetical protein